MRIVSECGKFAVDLRSQRDSILASALICGAENQERDTWWYTIGLYDTLEEAFEEAHRSFEDRGIVLPKAGQVGLQS